MTQRKIPGLAAGSTDGLLKTIFRGSWKARRSKVGQAPVAAEHGMVVIAMQSLQNGTMIRGFSPRSRLPRLVSHQMKGRKA